MGTATFGASDANMFEELPSANHAHLPRFHLSCLASESYQPAALMSALPGRKDCTGPVRTLAPSFPASDSQRRHHAIPLRRWLPAAARLGRRTTRQGASRGGGVGMAADSPGYTGETPSPSLGTAGSRLGGAGWNLKAAWLRGATPGRGPRRSAPRVCPAASRVRPRVSWVPGPGPGEARAAGSPGPAPPPPTPLARPFAPLHPSRFPPSRTGTG